MANASGPPEFLKNKDLAPVATDASNKILPVYERLTNADKKRVHETCEDLAKERANYNKAEGEYANKLMKIHAESEPYVFKSQIEAEARGRYPNGRGANSTCVNKFLEGLGEAKEHITDTEFSAHVNGPCYTNPVIAQIDIKDQSQATTILVCKYNWGGHDAKAIWEKMDLYHKVCRKEEEKKKLLRVIVCPNETEAQKVNDLKPPQGVIAWSPDMFKKRPEQSTGREPGSDSEDDAPPSTTTRTFTSWFAHQMLHEMVPLAVD